MLNKQSESRKLIEIPYINININVQGKLKSMDISFGSYTNLLPNVVILTY